MSPGEISALTGIATALGSGIGWLIRGQRKSAAWQADIGLKVNTMWIWFTNHGSHITGYKREESDDSKE